MSLLRLLFNSSYRRARQAEGAGDYRRAASLYAEADAVEEAANALLFHAARSVSLEERLSAWHDALRWLPDGHPRRREVEARMGRAVLDDAQRRGALGRQERERLREAAERLERVGCFSEAATAWELLGRTEEVARALERAGEVERLEQVLERTSERDARERRLRRLMADYEMSMEHGARLEARRALREAAELAADDVSIADLLRRIEERLPAPGHVALRVEDRRLWAVGTLPAVLGRGDADVALRGASVSRHHARLERRADGQLAVRDLGSRNGTLVRGVPLAGELVLGGSTVLGLGEDVELQLEPHGEGLRLEVTRGVDRGLEILVGDGPLRPPGLAAALRFDEGYAALVPDEGAELLLGTRRCAAPVILLAGDTLTVDGRRIEVLA